jgi:hypothetical protein
MNSEIERPGEVAHTPGASPARHPSDEYSNSLALCMIDAMYVTGARHLTVENIIARYRAFRAGQGADADSDGVAELLANIAGVGGPYEWATAIGNRRPTSTAKNAPLRAVALVEIAQQFAALGISTAADLRAIAADDDELSVEVQRIWCAIPGQRSGFTWRYLLMLVEPPCLGVAPPDTELPSSA